MKLAILATIIAGAAAFAPSTGSRASTSLSAEVDRRVAFAQIGVAAAGLAGLPSVASADGAVSSATITKARLVYGSRIADLKDAVAKAEYDAIAAEKNAFILFNSGAYPGAKVKASKAAAIEGTNKIFAAIRAKDAAALKSAYESYVKENDIKPIPKIDASKGQGYSSDFSYLAKTPAGTIYVR